VHDRLVGPDGPLRVAVLIEVEAVEANLLDRAAQISSEMRKPPGVGRVDEGQEVSESVWLPRSREQRDIPPVGPFVISHCIDGGITERPASNVMQHGDQLSDGLERYALAERIVVALTAAEQVGMTIRPVVEQNVRQMQTSSVIGHRSDLTLRTVVSNEPVTAAVDAGGDDFEGRSCRLAPCGDLDAVATRCARAEADETSIRHVERGDLVAEVQQSSYPRTTQVAHFDDDIVF
jgi:hypothetical protein